MSETIMITGGTGYVGSWVVFKLLEKGYVVRLTTRNKSKTTKFQYLLDKAEQTSGTLEIWEADLLQEGEYDKVAEGCKYIIHMASPFTITVDNPQDELIEPALKGTINVLNAANNSSTVRKIVLTSSVAAIHGDNIDMKDKGIDIFTEEHFNSTSSVEHQPYSYSKVLAEKKAWEMQATQEQWELVVINPAFVMGPPLSPRTDSGSITLMKQFLGGKFYTGAPDLKFGFVDVRNVADAHIHAMENTEAEGRHIICERVCNLYEFSQIIKKVSTNKYKLPLMKAPKFLVTLLAPAFDLTREFVRKNVGYDIKFDNTKSRESLHIDYIPLEETLKDMIAKMEELGMVK